ncbi:MAG: cell division topological specificity factor MinE [Clostridia bacterium]|nr:cell division topological specificity factor MinE [Clostridia bacterium]MBR5156832.1 cell division topological specificity factor MinE [Clostridia bacterium]
MDFSSLINKFFAKNKSKDVAKDRLKLVLMGDRGVSPELLDKIKGEIMEVLSKYMEISDDGLEFKMTKTDSEDGTAMIPALIANIPIKHMRANSTGE